MRCLIDGRVFLDRRPGGVTKVAERLVPAVMRAGAEHAWTVGTTGVGATFMSPVRPSIAPGDMNVAPTHVLVPNKLVALATWMGCTSFDRLIPGEFDVMFLPNLEMVGRPRIPYVLLVHDLSFLVEPRWFIPKTRLWHTVARAKELIRGADALLAVSERTKSDLIRLLRVSPEKIQIMPLGLTNTSPNLSSPEERDMSKKPYFLVLGGNDPRKNVACVRTAFQMLKQEEDFKNVGLVTCGETMRPSDDELAMLMRNASAFLYPSWYEGFGLPLHEAARFGTPIIASTAGALPETAPTGTVFVPSFKPHLWLQAMRAVLRQPTASSTSAPSDWNAAGQIVVDTLRLVAKNG